MEVRGKDFSAIGAQIATELWTKLSLTSLWTRTSLTRAVTPALSKPQLQPRRACTRVSAFVVVLGEGEDDKRKVGV